MTDHPIIPPDEMVEEWRMDYMGRGRAFIGIAKEIAQWGADAALEACCEILRGEFNYHHLAEPLRAFRRPKPPSLKEQALDSFEFIGRCHHIASPDWDNIRRALEALPND